MRGRFITVEGTDGAGKSTQIDMLVSFLEKKGVKTLVTREPGGTEISEKLREIILDPQNKKMTDITEAMLYAAARAQHVEEKIIPALKEGIFVICDRFVDSSIAYQGYARGIDINMIESINSYAVCQIVPDVTLFFDLSPEKGISRKKNMHELDRIEQEKIDFHKKVYFGYQQLLEKYPERIKRINADDTIENVHRQVVDVIEKMLK